MSCEHASHEVAGLTFSRFVDLPAQGIVNPSPSPRHPALFRGYYSLLLAVAALLVVTAVPHAALPSPQLLIGGFVLLVVAELSPVTLPGGGYATAGTVVDLPLLLFAGPLWTAVLDAAIFVLGAFAAWAVWRVTGGRPGAVVFPRDVLPLLACGATFFLVNSACVSVVIGLTAGPSPWRIWQRNFQQGILHHLSFV